MTAATALQDAPVVTPLGPAPAVPENTPSLPPELAGPSLADAVTGDTPELGDVQEAPDAPPMTPEQIIGLVAEVSAFGLPAGISQAYKDDFKNNPIVNLGVQASGLADALAAYGLTAGGGKLPEWLSVLLGVTVLGYGVFSTRSKYAQPIGLIPTGAETASDSQFSAAGVGTPLQATNIGFANAGQ